jgi:hypothetical protein
MPPPLVFDAREGDDEVAARAVTVLLARTPAIVLGRAAFDPAMTNQALAFLAGFWLTSLRPGFYVRHLVPTGTGRKAWLFAAIRLTVPQFAIPAELTGPVEEAMKAVSAELSAVDKEHLASAVGKLLVTSASGGAPISTRGHTASGGVAAPLDLKRWSAAIERAADRVGLVFAHDLRTATEGVRATEKDATTPVKERMKELVLFSVGEEYFALRRKLGIAIRAKA